MGHFLTPNPKGLANVLMILYFVSLWCLCASFAESKADT